MDPPGTILWYDAVTMEGRLQWQDTLSDLNAPFFLACDGLFVNYTWTADTPRHAAAAAAACSRDLADVYMGVDVFGRNTYGGGGMSCDVAIKAALEAGAPSSAVPSRLAFVKAEMCVKGGLAAGHSASRGTMCS